VLRYLQILLIITVALWALLSAVDNLAEWSGTNDGVTSVTSMSTYQGGPFRWRANHNPVVVIVGSVFITLSKVASGCLCLLGALQMWRARRQDTDGFTHAKSLALSGCAVAILLFFGGFVVIAEGWFEMWRSSLMSSTVSSTAFRYGAMITLISLFVAIRS
jgi:predicted small integral membrane protein